MASSHENASQKSLDQIIAEKKHQLDTSITESFSSFDPQFTAEEHEMFETLQIKKPLTYNLYGSPEGKEEEINEYIQSLGNDQQTSQSAAQAIVRMSKEILAGFDLPAAWVTLRASHPNNHFDIPRWHTDGHKNLRYKVVMTLQGPGTLLSKVTTETRAEYRKRDQQGREKIKDSYPELSQREQSIKHSDENRELFVSLFPADKVQQAAPRQGIIFIVGNEQTAAFHSEPRINTCRLFMSVMPGTVEHIEDWRNQCNK
ncbi:MAG: hypothetical protein Q8Q60_00340 [Candidatus Chromulinivorax sp.]|nr:hypothetical protein [Candidatus Chromulinivorax sp.]